MEKISHDSSSNYIFIYCDINWNINILYRTVFRERRLLMCGCGRSPREDGKCVGFHKLSEEVWNERKEILVEEYKKSQDSSVGRADA